MINQIEEILKNQKDNAEEKIIKIEKILNLANNEFENLKKILESNEWPEAVMDFQIIDENSEEEKLDRAEGIVDILIDESLENKKFLDFGCGEGHAVVYASKYTKTCHGYDIVKSGNLSWENDNNFLLTTKFEKIENNKYDMILIYDVLDHSENPIEILSTAKSLLSETGKIYLRCHPWSGRHASHLYRKINKAFIHLVFSDEELKEMGYEVQGKNQKIIYPIANYKEIIGLSGLKITKEPDIDLQDVEDFFKNNTLVSDRIKKSIPIKDMKFPEFQMSQCFIDYVLTKE